MTLGRKLSDFWGRFQGELFPALSEEVGPLLGTHRRFVAALDLVGVEGFVGAPGGGPGRPPEDRRALARAFLAKAVWDLPTTRHLIDRLGADPALRRLCGWSRFGDIPSEATFSRAFAEFSASRLAERMHEALVVDALGEVLIGHVSRDSTAIEGREAAVAKPKKTGTPKRRPGRPRKGEERPKTPTRLERQADGMSLDAMLDDLPKVCDRGTKRNARGMLETWRGYKLHIDTADCGIPLSAILTSASLHDCQAAIPLATMTAERVVNLYDLMDAAYDATEIHALSKRLGHVPVIDTNPRRDKALKQALRALRRCSRWSPPYRRSLRPPRSPPAASARSRRRPASRAW
ncbi:MAG: transposase [Rhodospirillaceae bacterium]|nr:transposase [Rhodospirillaceae bacterium]MYB11768.1 transposase [Rhodospirillaceae bacterium]MYI50487.1 transposase [Rhodospirillaceae bacterium]